MSAPLVIDADRCPPVTAILAETLPPEPGGCTADPLWAAPMGTLIHYRILSSLAPGALPEPDLDLPTDADEIADRAVEIWTAFVAGFGLVIGHPREVEVVRASAGLGYAGAPDLVAPINGVRTLVEIKVAAYAGRFAARLQAGAYYGLIDPKPDFGLIVAIDPYAERPRASYVWLDRHALRGSFQAFLECARCYHREHLPVFDPDAGWRA